MILFQANTEKTNKIVSGFLISENKIEDRTNVGKNKCPSCEKIFEEKINIKDIDGSYFRMTCPYCEKAFEVKSNCFIINHGETYIIKPKTLAISLDSGITWHSNLDTLNNLLNLLKK